MGEELSPRLQQLLKDVVSGKVPGYDDLKDIPTTDLAARLDRAGYREQAEGFRTQEEADDKADAHLDDVEAAAKRRR